MAALPQSRAHVNVVEEGYDAIFSQRWLPLEMGSWSLFRFTESQSPEMVCTPWPFLRISTVPCRQSMSSLQCAMLNYSGHLAGKAAATLS